MPQCLTLPLTTAEPPGLGPSVGLSPVQDGDLTRAPVARGAATESTGQSHADTHASGEPHEDDGNASEDELLDEGDDPDLLGDAGALGLCWWKTVPFDSILSLECGTAGFVLEGVEHAVATLKGQLADHPSSTKCT